MLCVFTFVNRLVKNPYTILKLASTRNFSTMDDAYNEVLDYCKELLPVMSANSHKGSSGRIGVVGGSVEFTGAPYYAGISALRTGADLVYVFSSSTAAPVIKSYCPELMVMPYLDSDNPMHLISPWLNRLHAILIGPGLGRNESTNKVIDQLIKTLKSKPNENGYYRPLVFDADGLYFLSKHPQALKDYQGDVYLTPNIMEFKTLIQSILGVNSSESKPPEVYIESLCKEISLNVTIVLKGKMDMICNTNKILQCKNEGSFRRCGGQGDMLSGILSTFAAWVALRRIMKLPHVMVKYTDNILAGYSACVITRACNKEAFKRKARTMLTTDMISDFSSAYLRIFGAD